ncbi:hypothetical protein STRDD11_02478 [Streptococcus sp. DD11]|nr:hypothetical protein STRDD11_02478 [Streptococcus sp. DD11]
MAKQRFYSRSKGAVLRLFLAIFPAEVLNIENDYPLIGRK